MAARDSGPDLTTSVVASPPGNDGRSREVPRRNRYSDACSAASLVVGVPVGYIAGLVAIAIIVFGWPYWPIGWIVIAVLLAADFVLET